MKVNDDSLQVLSLLRDAAGQVEGETAQLVKDAVKVLSSHELYAPSITRFRNDRIATQYYDGLIRLYHPTRHRRRSVVDAFRDKKVALGERRRVSADVKNALENDSDWSFDVLLLEKVTEHHALSQIGLKIFERWKVADSLGCNEDILERWLCTIESHYHAGNAYHNATHAADVLQATSYFLDSPSVAAHVSENHAIAALIAATVHDLDHPGRGNAFLINTRQSLAVLYNDHSVLENHHVALAFQLTLQQNSNVNIFGNLSREEFTSMRHSIVEMVLATDISRHFEYLVRFNKVKSSFINLMTLSREREKGLPVTMEVFDRLTCNVPLTQCGFIDMFAREAFANFAELANLAHLCTQLESNYDQWKSLSTSWIPANNLSLHL
uniref:3',5'-cyclic-nucleotide phosphodiesterase n=1 Tax=Angiostrongylus cantonensis TaxID=6313 RepID=A0A0K0DHH4_ANGCA